jgi:hypothetical protein
VLRTSTAIYGLAVLLLVGLLIRLTLAYVLLPSSGFESDIGTFTAWALQLAEHGPGTFYASAGFADYPPGYLYVLWLVGGLGHLLAPFGNGDPVSVTTTLIKLPAIFADVAVAAVLYGVVRSWRSPRLDAHRLALIAAALYLLNPVSWYDSAIWGQTDAFAPSSSWSRSRRWSAATPRAQLASPCLPPSSSPNSASFCCPLWGSCFFVAISCDRDRVRGILCWPRGCCDRGYRTSRAMATHLVGCSGTPPAAGPHRPFSLNIVTFVGQMAKTAAGYPYLSVNGYNPWALIGSNGSNGIAFGGACRGIRTPWASLAPFREC